MTTSSAPFLLRSYTPLSFRPDSERRVVYGLSAMSAVLWLFLIPLELVLG